MSEIETAVSRSLPIPEGLSQAASERLRQWLQQEGYAALRAQAVEMIESARADPRSLAVLEDAFCRDLPIGTGGRRGEVGPGPNRINEVVLAQTAMGVAHYVQSDANASPTQRGRVVVAFDTRRDSHAFARLVSRVLASQGLAVRLLDAPRATPQLAFEVRQWSAGAGVVISASHNPPSDNGIKIYGCDGAQVLGENDRRLMEAIERVSPEAIPTAAIEAGEDSAARVKDGRAGSIEALRPGAGLDERDRAYAQYVASQGVWGGSLSAGGLKIVYTPLHGVGHHIFVPLLEGRGADLACVKRQLDPDDGRFSSVDSANPESPAAFDLGRALADEHGADLVIAHDPDADRLGALLRGADGELHFIDGNRLGALLLDHLLRHAPSREGISITTLVSSPLLAKMARAHGLEVVDDLLVGFKHHAGLVAESPERPVFFACEESHGYVRGNGIRDKDGAIGGLLLAEAAAACAENGGRLLDRLDAIWGEHGYHKEKTRSVWARGAAGRAAIAAVMRAFRANPPDSLGALNQRASIDRLVPRDTGSSTRDLPGDVLSFEYANDASGCRVVLRPSGTEPKLKIYALAHAKPGADSQQHALIDALIDEVLSDAEQFARAIMAPLLGDETSAS